MPRPSYILVFVFCLISVNSAKASFKDSFSEELLIKPLPNNHVYTFFQFMTTWSSDAMCKQK